MITLILNTLPMLRLNTHGLRKLQLKEKKIAFPEFWIFLFYILMWTYAQKNENIWSRESKVMKIRLSCRSKSEQSLKSFQKMALTLSTFE